MYAANTRRQIRATVSGVLQQAVLHKAIPTNPVRELERIESPKGHKTASPRGLTPEGRRRLLAFVDTNKAAIRADLPDLIRFALGCGLRIGEICVVRWMDEPARPPRSCLYQQGGARPRLGRRRPMRGVRNAHRSRR